MQKKAAAWSGEISCEKMDIPHPLVSAVNLVYLLTSSLDCAPVIYPSADNELWAYYPNSCFVCEEFLESYGWFMAAAGITVYGGADGFESGQLTAELNTNGESLRCAKLNVSGTDYETIRDTALKIPVQAATALSEYQRLLSAISPKCSYIAAERTELIENVFRDIPQQSEDTYFRYIVLTGYDCCLNVLSIQQRKKLWLMYFNDGLSPLEFEDAFSAIERGEISEFPWELALRLALEEAGITVSYENGYCVNDRSGKRISPDFSSELAAERLFAKLIFPKKPPKV